MHANQTDVQKILGGVQQYVVPMFQRPYSWKDRQWMTLWTDLKELCEESKPRNHFIGSVVTMPDRSVPEGVSKYILIDGQQRLTTLLLLLAAIRDKARRDGEPKLADKIEDLLLKNRHQDGTDIYKVLPTQADRPTFCAVMDSESPPPDEGIAKAYAFFDRKLRVFPIAELDRLYSVICKSLVLVSIVLDRDDNPYLIFESLNAKGQPLAQADLIRNFFFMRLRMNTQEAVFRKYWQPMQDRLGDHLTEFVRHLLMREGKAVKQGEIYFTVKERVDELDEEAILAYLTQMAVFSTYYERLIDPSKEPDKELAVRVTRQNRFEATTTYPFLLNVYDALARHQVTVNEVASVLEVLESFLIRRYVCGVPTNALTRIFAGLPSQGTSEEPLLKGVKNALADKNYPSDDHFADQFKTIRLYGGGDRRDKAKLILERLEESHEHKERTGLDTLSIEHVMPQTPTEWWKEHLGTDWAAVHSRWLDTAGNLTLTGYNPELSNSDFTRKKELLAKSHVELNRYFPSSTRWDEAAICKRGESLAALAIKVWPNFAENDSVSLAEDDAEDASFDGREAMDYVLDKIGTVGRQVGGGRFRIYKLSDGRIICLKYSRHHPRHYWYGLHASLWADLQRVGATHLALILGSYGYALVPMDVLTQYVADARVSSKANGEIRHYHLCITPGSKPELFHFGNPERFNIESFFTPFSSDDLSIIDGRTGDVMKDLIGP